MVALLDGAPLLDISNGGSNHGGADGPRGEAGYCALFADAPGTGYFQPGDAGDGVDPWFDALGKGLGRGGDRSDDRSDFSPRIPQGRLS